MNVLLMLISPGQAIVDQWFSLVARSNNTVYTTV